MAIRIYCIYKYCYYRLAVKNIYRTLAAPVSTFCSLKTQYHNQIHVCTHKISQDICMRYDTYVWWLTGDFVIGGSECSECFEVPEEDGVV